MDTSLSVILESPGHLAVRPIDIPAPPGETVAVEMRACGICGSDIRYLHGENPWSQHTLGRNIPSPPNMVLGHEVSGVAQIEDGDKPVAVLAFKACGACGPCRAGNENLCETMMHFGHSAGWPEMPYYPGGMTETFRIWKEFAVEIPPSVGYEAAVFLDGLAVAIHALDTGGMREGKRICVVGLGPIGMLVALAAKAFGADLVYGCDTDPTPVALAEESGCFDEVVSGSSGNLTRLFSAGRGERADIVLDTLGTSDVISHGLSILDKGGIIVLLAVHSGEVTFSPLLINGERRIATSANNRYADFSRAIDLLATGKVRVEHLITHRFPLSRARDAFFVMENKEREKAFKVILLPE